MKSYRSQLWSSSAAAAAAGSSSSGGGVGGRFDNCDEANLTQKLFKHNNSEMDCDYSKLFYAKRK